MVSRRAIFDRGGRREGLQDSRQVLRDFNHSPAAKGAMRGESTSSARVGWQGSTANTAVCLRYSSSVFRVLAQSTVLEYSRYQRIRQKFYQAFPAMEHHESIIFPEYPRQFPTHEAALGIGFRRNGVPPANRDAPSNALPNSQTCATFVNVALRIPQDIGSVDFSIVEWCSRINPETCSAEKSKVRGDQA